MEHCNICNTDVEDVEAHIRMDEHLENLKKIESIFKSKVYENDKSTSET